MVALIVAESGVSEKNFLCRLKRWKRGGMQCIHSAALGTRTTGEIGRALTTVLQGTRPEHNPGFRGLVTYG
jgi:hypothetical protein